MLSKRLIGKDQYDLDQQIWVWRSNNPNLRITRIHPTEDLDVIASAPLPLRKIDAKDRVAVVIDYEEIKREP